MPITEQTGHRMSEHHGAPATRRLGDLANAQRNLALSLVTGVAVLNAIAVALTEL